MKPKLRARRMWANWYHGEQMMFGHPSRAKALAASDGQARPEAIRVAVIPLDDVDALVLKASLAIDNVILCGSVKVIARAALTAIGVLPKPRKGGRK